MSTADRAPAASAPTALAVLSPASSFYPILFEAIQFRILYPNGVEKSREKVRGSGEVGLMVGSRVSQPPMLVTTDDLAADGERRDQIS
jgi:hypothetical protein